MTRFIRRALAAAAAASLTASAVVLLGGSASAFDAGALAAVVNNNTPSSTSGTNFDAVQFQTPGPCNAAATRHTVIINGVTADDPADQAAADLWAGDLLYSPSSVGLPGPLTTQSNGSWQQIADAFGQQLVPGTYSLELRCQNSLATTIYEEWSGGVVFSSPTAWTGFVGPAPTSTPTPTTPTPTPTTPTPTPTTPTPTPTTPAPTTPAPTTPAPTTPAPDTTAPSVAITAPLGTTTLAPTVAVAWQGSDNVKVTSYDVRYRAATWKRGFGGFVLPSAWQATGSTASRMAITRGQELCFSARARDAAGNVSGWSSELCSARPLDDRALKATSGSWVKGKGKPYYSHTIRTAKAKGSTLTRAGAKPGRAQLVVAKGKGFGKVGVFYNGKLVKTIKLGSTKSKAKVVVSLPRLAKKGTIAIKVLSSGKPAPIDGLLLAPR